MGDTLTVSGQKQAYTLTDEATFLTYKKNNDLQLVPIIDEGESLLNRYTVMTISPEKYPNTNVKAAPTSPTGSSPKRVRNLLVTTAPRPTANPCLSR